MTKFDPPNLEATLREAIESVGPFIDVLVSGWTSDNDPNADLEGVVTIDTATEVILCFPRTEDGPCLSVQEFIGLSIEVADPETIYDGLTYHSHLRTVIRMNAWDIRSFAFAERVGKEDCLSVKVASVLAGHPCSIRLRSVSPYFAAAVVLKNYFYDKYNPPQTHDELFIEVDHPYGATAEDAKALVQAYLFELQVTLGLEYFEWPRPEAGEIEYPEDEEIGDLIERARSLRPLLQGQGLLAVLSEFNSGHGTIKSEASLLAYVKCIEYVSATVVREKQYEDFRKRLLSKEALSPNAEFMDGLLILFEENRIFTRDVDAMRLSIERCCDPVPMAIHAPKFLRNLAAIRPTSNVEQRKAALAEFAAALSASRNQMTHAKANYRATGKECPQKQIVNLVACARIAAEQCIRWYASRSAELRRG